MKLSQLDTSRLSLDLYRYNLPEEKIAQYPIPERDQSKLLHYREGNIENRVFHELPEVLPAKSLLVFNNTRVIPARLFFRKESGAVIELFLLHPVLPTRDLTLSMQVKGSAVWQCLVGNRKRWKEDQELHAVAEGKGEESQITATWHDREANKVRLEWNENLSFAEWVEEMGAVPLPPYMHREATDEDRKTYQTVYSKVEGSVAAPTAGLHFTDRVLDALKAKGFGQNYLTLHVSAGTFQPIKTENVLEHPMHEEQVEVTKENILALLEAEGPTIPVGTTSMRTLESMYWYGVKLLHNPASEFFVEKLFPYEQEKALPSKKEALEAILHKMEKEQIEKLHGSTEIFIFPGYTFRVCEGIITNFHQPGSTLMLLVAALVGDDWQKIYDHALSNNYRFLSYGDSSLLLPKKLKK